MSPPNTPVTIAPEKRQIDSENCLPIGTRLAEFELTGIIGEGGFGIVYQAFDHSLRRTVAIKEYMPGALAVRGPENAVVARSKRQQETFDTGLKSFIHEARLLARFDHPALIKVYRFWEENKTGYMAMRCYQGVTLKSIVANESAAVTEAWLKDLLRPLLEALDALYQAQILHRDISPDNIIIQGSGEPVLLDFGAARQIIGDMTQALTVILKPGYAPIEQYADDASMKQGPWTDIYSLSAVVYSLITKKLPPTSVARIIKDPIESLESGTHPGFSAGFLAAIDKGLAVRPEHRPQSIEEFRTLLGIDSASPSRSEAQPAAVVPIVPARKAPDSGIKESPDKSAKRKAARETPATARRFASNRPGLGTKLAWGLLVVGIMVIGGSTGYLLVKRGSEATANVAAPAPSKSGGVAGPQASTAAARSASADAETSAWEALYDETPVKAESVNNFLRKYPTGKYAGLARAKLAELAAIKAPKKSTEPPDRKSIAQEEKQASDKPAKALRTIRINIRPWGNVLLDGTEKGVSPPLKKLALPEGKHQIRIVNPSFPDYVIDVDSAKKKMESIEYDFSPIKK